MPTITTTQIRKEQIRNFSESVNGVLVSDGLTNVNLLANLNGSTGNIQAQINAITNPHRVIQEMTVTDATDTTVIFDHTALESHGVSMSLNGLKLHSDEFSFDELKAIYGNTSLPLVAGDVLSVEYFTLDEEEEE